MPPSTYDKHPRIEVPDGEGRCVSGWDAVRGQAINVSSDGSADLGPGSGRSGSQVLAAVFDTYRSRIIASLRAR